MLLVLLIPACNGSLFVIELQGSIAYNPASIFKN